MKLLLCFFLVSNAFASVEGEQKLFDQLRSELTELSGAQAVSEVSEVPEQEVIVQEVQLGQAALDKTTPEENQAFETPNPFTEQIEKAIFKTP